MATDDSIAQLAGALLGAEEVLEILHLRGTLGVEKECNAGRIAEVYKNVRDAKQAFGAASGLGQPQ